MVDAQEQSERKPTFSQISIRETKMYHTCLASQVYNCTILVAIDD